ncbi:MAG: tetratricopeptide repeat protein, partial [Candidatus Diapherotrites archaeon]
EIHDYSNAISKYNQVITLDPNFGDGYLALGDVYLLQKNYEKAIENYNKALNINANNMVYNLKLGIAYRLANQLESAISQLNKLLTLSKPTPDTYYHLGLAYNSKGEKIIVVHNAGFNPIFRPIENFGYGKNYNKLKKHVYYTMRFIYKTYSQIKELMNGKKNL